MGERMHTTPPDVDMARFEGQPAKGPADAAVTIATVGDFQCAYCRALAHSVEAVQRRHPDQVRVIYVNSPISSRCNPAIAEDLHPGACWLARAGEAAQAQGKFWEYHDLLYRVLPLPRVREEVVRDEIAELGLDPDRFEQELESETARDAVRRDVELCAELGLTATPSLVINGYVKRGSMLPGLLDAIVDLTVENADGPRLSAVPASDP
jgi:protein-disulfide isomerase